MAKRRKGRSAAFMRSINPHLKHKSRSTKRGNHMARRKYKGTRSAAFNLWASVIGVGLFIAYEVWVSPMVPLAEPMKSIAELALGIAFAKKKGVIGNVAKAAVIINVYQLMTAYVAPMLSNVFAR